MKQLNSIFYIPYSRHKSDSGFVALISAIIIAAVLLIFVVGAGAGGFFTRFDVFGTEIKEVSYGLAEACVHTAVLEMSQDLSYDPGTDGDVVPVGTSEKCIICKDTSYPNIYVQASSSNSFTNLEAVTNSDFEIVDINEVANHSSACTI